MISLERGCPTSDWLEATGSHHMPHQSHAPWTAWAPLCHAPGMLSLRHTNAPARCCTTLPPCTIPWVSRFSLILPAAVPPCPDPQRQWPAAEPRDSGNSSSWRSGEMALGLGGQGFVQPAGCQWESPNLEGLGLFGLIYKFMCYFR